VRASVALAVMLDAAKIALSSSDSCRNLKVTDAADSRLRQDFEPQRRFVRFVERHANPGDEFGTRPRPARTPVVRRNLGARAKQLTAI